MLKTSTGNWMNQFSTNALMVATFRTDVGCKKVFNLLGNSIEEIIFIQVRKRLTSIFFGTVIIIPTVVLLTSTIYDNYTKN